MKQDGAIVNKAAYMVIGIDLDGNKGMHGIWIGESESAKLRLRVRRESSFPSDEALLKMLYLDK